MYNHISSTCQPTAYISTIGNMVEIRDAFRNLRYQVQLISQRLSNDRPDIIYTIVVWNAFSAATPFRIKTIEALSPTIAKCAFRECVVEYVSLVKAETRDFQDINVYKDRIQYGVTKPNCCATCKWCVPEYGRPREYTFGIDGKLKCTNPKNQTNYDANARIPTRQPFNDDVSKFMRDRHLPEPTPPHHMERVDLRISTCPNVDQFGLCPNYELRREPYCPVDGDKLTRIIDRRIRREVVHVLCTDISNLIDNQFTQLSGDLSTFFDTALNNTLSSDILPTIESAIDHQMSAHPPIIDGNRCIDDYFIQDLNYDGAVDANEDQQFDDAITIIGNLES